MILFYLQRVPYILAFGYKAMEISLVAKSAWKKKWVASTILLEIYIKILVINKD
jgi:hypothetical protein